MRNPLRMRRAWADEEEADDDGTEAFIPLPERTWTPFINSHGRRTLLGEYMDELEERLIKAGQSLHDLESDIMPSALGGHWSRADIERMNHLSSKREGVNLAISYVQEMKRR